MVACSADWTVMWNVALARISVELWYAGKPDADGNYYPTDEYRGQVIMDECEE